MEAELARAAHAEAFARYRQAYDEQVRLVGVNQ